MLEVVALVFPLFALVFLGFLSGKLVRIDEAGLKWMNFFIIYIALPALFYQLIAKTPVEQFANMGFVGVTTLATFLIFVLVFVIGLRRSSGDVGGNIGAATVQGLAGAYGNIGYMAPPLAIAAFGPQAGVPVALIFAFENAMHFIIAPMMMALHERKKAGAQPDKEDTCHWSSSVTIVGEIISKIFTHPFILATIVGFLGAYFSVLPPEPIERLLTMLAGAAAPAALFVMGVTAALRPLQRVPVELSYILPVKLIIHPLLVYAMLAWLAPDTEPIWVYTAILIAGLPVATNVFVIAQQYDCWVERASSAVILSTFFAVFSVTILLYLIRSGQIW